MTISLRKACIEALQTADPDAKAAAAIALKAAFANGKIEIVADPAPMPDRPARPAKPVLIPPGAMPKRGKGTNAQKRFATLHALAHIELNAIDLALDAAGRWGAGMPADFTADWLRIASEEAFHFSLLQSLLREAGGTYGDLPAHDGLWSAAEETANNLLARLAIVPQVLEARGLDVTPMMIGRFKQARDTAVVQVLERILVDEITHVEAGNRWFRHLCAESGLDPVQHFHQLVQTHFHGALKPPFNDSARHQAGLTTDWYADLGIPDSMVKSPLTE